MQKSHLYIFIKLTFAAIILYSCSENSDKRVVANLYKEREYLLKEFKNISIINRGKGFYQLKYYNGQSANTFFFEKKGEVLKFTNDSIQYPINEIIAFASVDIADGSNYVKTLENELNRLLKVMDDFKIKNVSAEFAPVGVNMKIYFGNYKALLYIMDFTAVKNERWAKYIKSGKKLDENWYYVKDEFEE